MFNGWQKKIKKMNDILKLIFLFSFQITHLTTEIGIRDKAAQIQKETYETEVN